MQGGAGLIPGQGTKIPHAPGSRNESVKQKKYCSKFNEDFKNGPKKKKKSLKKVKWILSYFDDNKINSSRTYRIN